MCYAALRLRMRGPMGSGCRMLCSSLNNHPLLMRLRYSKIFPPTQDELPSTEPKDETSTATSEPPKGDPQAKNPKTTSSDIEKDWEAVDKPSETASEKTTDISDEGEKIEAPKLADEEGEKVEKPKEKEPVDELAESGEVLPKSLLKDW